MRSFNSPSRRAHFPARLRELFTPPTAARHTAEPVDRTHQSYRGAVGGAIAGRNSPQALFPASKAAEDCRTPRRWRAVCRGRFFRRALPDFFSLASPGEERAGVRRPMAFSDLPLSPARSPLGRSEGVETPSGDFVPAGRTSPFLPKNWPIEVLKFFLHFLKDGYASKN